MEKGLISIIVPVFNTERYLNQCIDSILKQSYSNWELILVDDGTYDNSYKICKNYEQQDERIRIVSVNYYTDGNGEARNIGISLARGEYLAFIDSDDFVKESYLEELYQAAVNTNSDIAIGDYIYLKDGVFSFYEYKEDYGVKEIDREEVLKKVPNNTRFVTVWGKLFKANLFDYIRFNSGYYEDLELITRLYLMAKKFILVTNELYCYRSRAGSIVHMDLSFKKMNDFIKGIDSMLLTYSLAKLDDKPVRDRIVRELNKFREFLVDKELTQTDTYREVMWRLKVIKY